MVSRILGWSPRPIFSIPSSCLVSMTCIILLFRVGGTYQYGSCHFHDYVTLYGQCEGFLISLKVSLSLSRNQILEETSHHEFYSCKGNQFCKQSCQLRGRSWASDGNSALNNTWIPGLCDPEQKTQLSHAQTLDPC